MPRVTTGSSRPVPARARCTWWARQYPGRPVPELVELRVTECVAIPQDERVARVGASRAVVDAKRERLRRKRELEDAAKAFEAASARLEHAKRG